MTRRTIDIRRLSFGSLFKVHLVSSLGICVPFCLLGLLFGLFAPGRVSLSEGATLGEFYVALVALPFIWAPLYALFVSCAAWIAFQVKGALSRTSLVVIESEPPRVG